MNLYQDRLMHHYRHSLYRGTVTSPTFSSGQYNPSCGDAIVLTGVVYNDVVQRLLFEGTGCVISQAAASLLCQESHGKTLADLEQYDSTQIMSMLGMELGPTRLKCALLPLEALRVGLATYRVRDAKEIDARSCPSDERNSAERA